MQYTKSEIINLKKRILKKCFKRMNDMQKKAVFTVNGPLLILAGAGSGKTTVLVNRIANILNFGNAYYDDLAPNNILQEDIKVLENMDKSDDIDLSKVKSILSAKTVNPWNVLAITFTNKANSL